MSNPPHPLTSFAPAHAFFVGIDSDGCAFDSMEIKQKECFIPNTIKHWRMQPIAKYVRETVEFVNLYSKWRGTNRWPALVMVFDLLAERAEVRARGFTPPKAGHLRAFLADTRFPDSNDGLKAYMAQFPHPELETALAWSEAVNRTIAEIVVGLQPFPYVRECLEALRSRADMIVVSATPLEALQREWEEAGIAGYVSAIAGQEQGTKTQHLKLAAAGRYDPGHVLMVGDALGDLNTARDVGALFYPINPGHEEQSWQRFYTEGLQRFLGEAYAGEYEEGLIREFVKLLPEVPPWKNKE